jgi:hypothetical protein
MRKIISLLIIFFASTDPSYSKSPKWIYVGSSKAPGFGTYKLYIDISNIDVAAEGRSVWTMHDLKETVQNVSSMKIKTMYFCGRNQFQIKQSVYYADHMGSGDITLVMNGEWKVEDVIPGSIPERNYESVCSLKL